MNFAHNMATLRGVNHMCLKRQKIILKSWADGSLISKRNEEMVYLRITLKAPALRNPVVPNGGLYRDVSVPMMLY